MRYTVYLADVISSTPDGRAEPALAAGSSPQETLDKVTAIIDGIAAGRRTVIRYNRQELLQEITAGNDESGPFELDTPEYGNNGPRHLLSCKVIDVEL